MYKKTVKDLFKRLNGFHLNFCCAEACKALKKVFQAKNRLFEKHLTKAIERVSASFKKHLQNTNTQNQSLF